MLCPNGNGFNKNTINRQYSLKQIFVKPTRKSATVDLILTDIHKYYEVPVISAPVGTSDIVPAYGHHKNNGHA